jgi:hypothetical protein
MIAMELVMKTMLVVCRQCGYEKRVKGYSHEDAERTQIRLVKPCCEKYGSSNVNLYD